MICLLKNPKLLILDEPTNNLDYHSRNIIYNFIMKNKSPENLTILSTHNYFEAQYLCDRVAILHHGEKLIESEPGSIIQDFRKEDYILELITDSPERRMEELTVFVKTIPNIIWVKSLETQVNLIRNRNPRHLIGSHPNL